MGRLSGLGWQERLERLARLRRAVRSECNIKTKSNILETPILNKNETVTIQVAIVHNHSFLCVAVNNYQHSPNGANFKYYSFRMFGHPPKSSNIELKLDISKYQKQNKNT